MSIKLHIVFYLESFHNKAIDNFYSDAKQGGVT